MESGRRSNPGPPKADGVRTMSKQFYVYIMSNASNTAIYTGVTSNLPGRVYQHKEKLVPGFTSRYNINNLFYYEVLEGAYSAISREKQIKGGSRKDKNDLINGMNPGWEDLSDKL